MNLLILIAWMVGVLAVPLSIVVFIAWLIRRPGVMIDDWQD